MHILARHEVATIKAVIGTAVQMMTPTQTMPMMDRA